MLKFAFCRCFHLIWHFEGRFGCLLEGGFFKKICSQPIHSCQKSLLPEASRAVFDQNCPNAVYKSSTTWPSVSHAQKAMLKQSFKSDTTVSTTTFTTFLTETKEGGEERKRLSLLPSSLVLVRKVFPGNLFKTVSIVGLDGNKSHLWLLMEKKGGWVGWQRFSQDFTGFFRVNCLMTLMV